MKKSRFTETQIVSILKDWDAGAAVAELARKHGVHANTLIVSRGVVYERLSTRVGSQPVITAESR